MITIKKGRWVGRALTIYLLGPGVGESVVLVMPDHRVVVVDCCEQAGDNLAARLLDQLGVQAIDLLVVTHPDLDHVKGVAELVRDFSPARAWLYPFALTRDFLELLAKVTTAKGRPRHADAVAAGVELDRMLRDRGTVTRVTYGRSWRDPAGEYAIHALAPTDYDVLRAQDAVRGLIEQRRGQWRLTERGRAWLDAERPLGDLPNLVSIGLAIEWGSRKVVLSGDIENGNGHAHSGWRGVLAALDQPDDGRGHLVDDVDLVKVAHHGSRGAYSEDAWRRHARSRKTTGIVTTYSPAPLPDAIALASLRGSLTRLGITTDGGGSFRRAREAGWGVADAAVPASLGELPVLKVALYEDGSSTFARGDNARWFD